MKTKNRKKGTFLIVTGLLLVVAALILTGYNLWTEKSAGEKSEAVLKGFTIEEGAMPNRFGSQNRWVFIPFEDTADIASDQTGQWALLPAEYLIPSKDMNSGKWVFIPYRNSRDMVEISRETGQWLFMPLEIIKNIQAYALMMDLNELQSDYPDYLIDPDRDMPDVTIDGEQYIGILTIPSLELKLPVMGKWSYPHLKIAPCRYTGSVYKDDMVICGHNYDRHFGRLKTLKIGAEVDFTDAEENVFRFRVVEMETLKPRAVEQMTTGDWDLTLFTCTIGGATRVTVRCEKI